MSGPFDGLEPGTVTDAATLALAHESVPGEQTVAGSPSTGFVELTDAIGVWEMSPGAMRDVEADEVFVVLSGSATVVFDEPPLPPVELRPGSVVRLTAGMRTVWTVHETLRKVYVAG
ncbi:cupin domain-containing protein [Microbacterium cremeum]|uniref:cupin domain-containing protein n=1 Tax=Microbacterium cremeum TaxID=2782169 RepID=UPI001E3D1EF2|nr:cupin domain-containing protein [Microbacterium cremeum]